LAQVAQVLLVPWRPFWFRPDPGCTMDALERAARAAGGAAQHASAAVTGAVQSETVQGAVATAGTMAQQAADKGSEVTAQVKENVNKKTQQFQQLMELMVKKKLQQQIGTIVDHIPPILKSSTDDPDMPRVVARAKDGTIDTMWPDIREEIMIQAAVLVDGDRKKEITTSPACCLLAFLRYHIFPFDKTIWGQLKDPVWIIFTVVSLLPIAGLCPLMFLFIFCIIDKFDEYQLITFILQFKGTQFLSWGIIRTIVGYFTYLSCVTVPADDAGHKCNTAGPGAAGMVEIVIGGWLLQVVLIWTSFVMLYWAKEKGRTALKGKIEVDHTGAGGRAGGYLRNFLFYDVFCFIVCAAAIIYVVTATKHRVQDDDVIKQVDDWPVRHTLFACQVVYGYLSFPFFFFTLPVIKSILTHSVPTAYDSYGRTVAFTGPVERPSPEQQKSKVQAVKELFTAEEANKLMEKVKAIMMGSAVDMSDLEGP